LRHATEKRIPGKLLVEFCHNFYEAQGASVKNADAKSGQQQTKWEW